MGMFIYSRCLGFCCFLQLIINNFTIILGFFLTMPVTIRQIKSVPYSVLIKTVVVLMAHITVVVTIISMLVITISNTFPN